MTDHQQTPVHTFPDRGAGEWVAYEDYAAAVARAETAEAEVERLRDALKVIGYSTLSLCDIADAENRRHARHALEAKQ